MVSKRKQPDVIPSRKEPLHDVCIKVIIRIDRSAGMLSEQSNQNSFCTTSKENCQSIPETIKLGCMKLSYRARIKLLTVFEGLRIAQFHRQH